MIRKLADCNDLLLPKTDCGEARKVEYSISKSDHRSDIAVLRAIAIIAVFAFHFYPKIFPQGFLGVDIFFVISGYLIMRILSISDSPPFKKISTFYYRRIKRIFPLFYLVLAITGFAMLFIYSIAWTRRYFPFFSSSVYMRLNLRMETFDMSYFDQNGTGPLRVMVIGNSYAPQRALVLNKIFPKTIRSTLDLVAYPGKVILYQKFSKDFAIYLWELIEKRKPHFVFISMRYVKANGDFDPFEETDRRTKKYLNAIQHLSLHSRKIFIETALPFHCEPFVEIKNIANTEDFLNDFVDHLERNATLEKLNLSVDKSFFDAGPAIRRLEFIAKKCPKCHLIHLEEPYFDKEKEIFRMFDPISRKAYIDNRCHFTPSGLHLQFELFRKAVQPHIHKFLREKHLK
ncbi:unnamed protein product, partial [Mesorhabditis belari]|uniref:Acyltransferase n=1 Tax=Mesorhabditis belari TaxID=2138241 RepID=A0AAF3EE65_9BILA